MKALRLAGFLTVVCLGLFAVGCAADNDEEAASGTQNITGLPTPDNVKVAYLDAKDEDFQTERTSDVQALGADAAADLQTFAASSPLLRTNRDIYSAPSFANAVGRKWTIKAKQEGAPDLIYHVLQVGYSAQFKGYGEQIRWDHAPDYGAVHIQVYSSTGVLALSGVVKSRSVDKAVEWKTTPQRLVNGFEFAPAY